MLKKEGSFYPSVFGNVSFNSCGASQMPLLVLQARAQGPQAVVFPAQYESDSVVYPAPSWVTRNCDEDTSHCDGHGSCSDAGTCECDENYYGLANPLSCDGFCTVSEQSEKLLRATW